MPVLPLIEPSATNSSVSTSVLERTKIQLASSFEFASAADPCGLTSPVAGLTVAWLPNGFRNWHPFAPGVLPVQFGPPNPSSARCTRSPNES